MDLPIKKSAESRENGFSLRFPPRPCPPPCVPLWRRFPILNRIFFISAWKKNEIKGFIWILRTKRRKENWLLPCTKTIWKWVTNPTYIFWVLFFFLISWFRPIFFEGEKGHKISKSSQANKANRHGWEISMCVKMGLEISGDFYLLENPSKFSTAIPSWNFHREFPCNLRNHRFQVPTRRQVWLFYLFEKRGEPGFSPFKKKNVFLFRTRKK